MSRQPGVAVEGRSEPRKHRPLLRREDVRRGEASWRQPNRLEMKPQPERLGDEGRIVATLVEDDFEERGDIAEILEVICGIPRHTLRTGNPVPAADDCGPQAALEVRTLHATSSGVIAAIFSPRARRWSLSS